MKDSTGKPEWSWTYVMSHDIQANRMSRVMQTEACAGGYKSVFATNGIDVYNKYLTVNAISRLGAV